MNNKIIFLDIDGVLNPVHYSNALFKMWKASFNEIKSHDEYGQFFFYHNVDVLRYIINQTNTDTEEEIELLKIKAVNDVTRFFTNNPKGVIYFG